MSAVDCLMRIIGNPEISDASLKLCFHKKKKPFKDAETFARPNHCEDFVPLTELNFDIADQFDGIGFSVQASNVCGIDVDHCFSTPFDETTITELGDEIWKMFKDVTYVEFSYSGTGMRILFKAQPIDGYLAKYYTKNSNNHVEYYYPEGSPRYLTITGRQLNHAKVNIVSQETLTAFLDKYMKRPEKARDEPKKAVSEGDVANRLLHFLRTNSALLENWCEKAPGSGSNESERDYWLLNFIYENITADKDTAKALFESSPFFKSKDYKHMKKWTERNYRYFNYIWGKITNEY